MNRREISKIFPRHRLPSGCMIKCLSTLVSIVSFQFHSRVSLELEPVAGCHVHAAFGLSYRASPTGVASDCGLKPLRPSILAKLATMIRYHRKGIRTDWRSRCAGRSETAAEIRDLIRRMNSANPLWRAPRTKANCSSSP
jgi:hypothetical protein